MDRAGRNSGDNRRSNRGLCIRLISTGRCSTRSEMVRETGLSKMTISNIVGELMEQGILEETEMLYNDIPGRNPVKLRINPEGPKFAGVYISRGCCEGILCDLSLSIHERISEDIRCQDGTELMDLIFSVLDRLLGSEGKVSGIGIASVGPVNVVTGRLLDPRFFHGISGVDIKGPIEKRYGLPVYMNNDDQSALLAEALFGNARGFEDVLYIGAGPDTGCGVITNGKLFISRRGLCPQIGRLRLTDRLNEHPEELDDNDFLKDADELCEAVSIAAGVLGSELILLGENAVLWNDHQIGLFKDGVNLKLRGKGLSGADMTDMKKAGLGFDAPLIGSACNAVADLFSGSMDLA